MNQSDQTEYDHASAIFSAALRLMPEERQDFVRKAARGNEAVVADVDDLLQYEAGLSGFLEKPLVEILGEEIKKPVELAAGQLLKERYRILQLRAQGGFASVYFAADEVLADRQVVVKVLDGAANGQNARMAFELEVGALSAIHHPGVVGFSDCGALTDGTPFVVLGYVPGLTLREVMQKERQLSVDRVRALLREIGKGLAAVHQAGVSHLDLKPENIIVSNPGQSEERVTLIDLGMARLKAVANGNGLSGGSAHYMAPEQISSPSPRCDLYALAVMGRELLTSKPDGQWMVGAEDMAAVIERNLSQDPGQRSESVAEFLKGIEATEGQPKGQFLSSWLVVAVLLQSAFLAWMLFQTKP